MPFHVIYHGEIWSSNGPTVQRRCPGRLRAAADERAGRPSPARRPVRGAGIPPRERHRSGGSAPCTPWPVESDGTAEKHGKPARTGIQTRPAADRRFPTLSRSPLEFDSATSSRKAPLAARRIPQLPQARPAAAAGPAEKPGNPAGPASRPGPALPRRVLQALPQSLGIRLGARPAHGASRGSANSTAPAGGDEFTHISFRREKSTAPAPTSPPATQSAHPGRGAGAARVAGSSASIPRRELRTGPVTSGIGRLTPPRTPPDHPPAPLDLCKVFRSTAHPAHRIRHSNLLLESITPALDFGKVAALQCCAERIIRCTHRRPPP